MPETYAALLRRAADTLAQSDGSLYRIAMAEQMQALAALLDRVTPEVMQYIRPRITYDGNVAEQSDAIMATLRALAAGPDAEVTHG